MFILMPKIGTVKPSFNNNPARTNKTRKVNYNRANNLDLNSFIGNFGFSYNGYELPGQGYNSQFDLNIFSFFPLNDFGNSSPRSAFPYYANRQELFGPGFDVNSPYTTNPRAFYGYGNDYVSNNYWSWAVGSPIATNFLRSQGIPHGNYFSPWYSDQYGLITVPNFTPQNVGYRKGPSIIDNFAGMMDGINMPFYSSQGPSIIDLFSGVMDGGYSFNNASNIVTIQIISQKPILIQINQAPTRAVTSA